MYIYVCRCIYKYFFYLNVFGFCLCNVWIELEVLGSVNYNNVGDRKVNFYFFIIFGI